MSLADAAAEFAREVVVALSGEAGRDERVREAELQQLRDIVKTQHEKEQLLIAERDELRELYETEQRLRRQAEQRLAQKVGSRDANAERERLLASLRARVKDVLDNDGDLLDESRRVRLARAYRWTETPAEGAARLRVE